MEKLFTFLSGLVIVIAYLPFIRGTVKGTVVPNRATWTVWFVQDILMAASAIKSGVGPATVMPVIWGVGATIILAISINRSGIRCSFSGLEKVCLVLSGLGILLWATIGSPRLAFVASVSAACIGGVPTVLKAWAKPWTETMSGWLLMLTGTVFSALAIQKWTFNSGFLPIAMFVLQGAVTLPLVLHAINSKAKSEA